MKKILLLISLLAVVCMEVSSADKFVVVIDAGHGGRDPGAIRGKVKEKDINLAVALNLGQLIEDNHPDVKVVYTRKTDVAVDLKERSKIANKAKANLFISIHTNSTKATSTSAYGADTYTLGVGSSEENIEAAKRENSVVQYEKDYKEKYGDLDPNSPESNIIIEFLASKYMEQSIEFASYIQDGFRNVAKRNDRGVRQAGFWVLKDTTMPSVLIELGFINNTAEARYLSSTIGRRNMASAIYSGFKKYKSNFDKRTGDKTYVADNTKAAPVVEVDVITVEKTEAIVQTDTPAKQSGASTSRFYSKPKHEPVVTKKETSVSNTQSSQPVVAAPVTKTAATPVVESKQQAVIVKQPTPIVKQEPKPQVVQQAAPVVATPAKAVVDNNQVEYRVQILTSGSELAKNSPKLKGLSPVGYYIDGGVYKYTYGSTTNYDEALRLQRQARAHFSDAFVIHFKRGKRIK